MAAQPGRLEPGQARTYRGSGRTAAGVPNDLAFLVGLRQRARLSENDRGTRDVVLAGSRAYLANYFTDTLSVVDLAAERLRATSIGLGAQAAMTVIRKGELLFNDATICFQGWQSCASCHSSDARVDGLNWDNLNDGIGNPKNGKSLLQAHRTSPSMWLSVREDARTAVRAGIRHSMFTVRPEEDAVAMDEYLQSLQPIPSPFLKQGKLSAAAERGKQIFVDDKVGCLDCHSGPYFTDLKSHDVGTRGKYDKPVDKFDTPSLIEIWRTAPYLHDGSAVTLQDLLRKHNKADAHGTTSHLKEEEIDALAAYMLSL